MKVTSEAIIELNTDLCSYIRVVEENGIKVLDILKSTESFLYCAGTEALMKKILEIENSFLNNLNECKMHTNNLIGIAQEYDFAERSNKDRANGIN